MALIRLEDFLATALLVRNFKNPQLLNEKLEFILFLFKIFARKDHTCYKWG